MSVYVRHKLNGVCREDWLAMRKEGIGGSDSSVILGLNPFTSEMELWMDKVGSMPEKPASEAMRLGNELEDYVARRFCEETGKKVRRRKMMFGNTDYPWALANVDREIVGECAALECKTTNPFSHFDFDSGEIPPHYYVQCCHYMAVCGYARMYLAVLVLGKGFYHYVIERDDKEIEALMQSESEWWDKHVVRGEMPGPDGSKSAAEAIKVLFPKAEEGESQLLYSLEGTLRQIDQLNTEIGRMEKDRDMLRQQVQCAMGNAEIGISDGWKITWKNQQSTRVDSKLLREEYPTIYAAVAKQTSSRVLRISKKKGA